MSFLLQNIKQILPSYGSGGMNGNETIVLDAVVHLEAISELLSSLTER